MTFIKITEQDSLYSDLEQKTVRQILDDINREDRKVALAVQKTIPQVEKLVSEIVPRMQRGGTKSDGSTLYCTRDIATAVPIHLS